VSVARALPLLALAAALTIVASGFGTRFGVWDWRAGFTILRWGTYTTFGVMALALVALLVPRLRARGPRALVVALVLATSAVAVPVVLLLQARETAASAQRAAYPEIVPIVVAKAPGVAFDAALAAARSLGWTIVATDAASGRIEATATTSWFGFSDDVVIRVVPAQGGSRVDVRSVSRVGKGDLGANAGRVRAFTAIVAGKASG
jgi:uncharacterized protein (DUF1499 family)